MSKIKLFKLSTMKNGTIRLQSQLSLRRNDSDFIMEKGILKCFGRGKRGFDFYKYTGPYEIVEDINEMKTQIL